jgi:hypothetical protein
MATYPEPTWSGPTDYLTESIFTRRPVLSSDMTAILIRLLQFHFSTPAYIERDKLKHLIWNVDRDKSKILIGPEVLKNSKDVGRTPTILIGPLSTSVEQIGVEETEISSKSAAGVKTVFNDPNRNTRMNINIHGIFSRGLNGTESDALRDEILIFLTAYAVILRRDLNLWNVNVKGIDQSKKVDGKEADWFVHPIQLIWSAALSYTVTEDIPI